MTLESQVASLTTATTSLLDAVNVKKSTLDASVATATTKADVATTKAGEASGSAASALAIYGNTAAMNTAVSTSTTNAATATTKAGEAATSASAAAGSASTAASQATTATGAASAATTQAGAASASATNAATSATAAAGSATSAATSASSATNSASAAATSATAAAGSNTAAAAQASAAAGSAASALAIAATATTKAGEAATSASAAAASAASAAAIVTGVSSNRPSVRPSLLIDFAATGKLDPRITFGRSSPAMAYDGKTTVKAEENLFIYSQVIGNWTKSAITVTDNVAVAPDGTTTASKLVATAASGGHTAYQLRTDPTAGNSYTVTVFAKAAEYSKLYISDVGLGRAGWLFDLLNGTVLTQVVGVSASINSAGNGWYRCSLTFLNGAGNTYIGLAGVPDTGYTLSPNYAQYTGDATSGIYLWGAQLEQRAYATAYTPTTTAAITNYIPALQSYAANVARFDFNPVTGESLGLMVEEQRANLLSYSQQFDVPTWAKSRSSIAQNVIIAPDGTLSGCKFIDSTATSNTHDISQFSIPVVNGSAYTFSVYAKAGELNWLMLGDNTSYTGRFFNLATGVAGGTGAYGATSSYSITPAGNGWYRCSITTTQSTTTGKPIIFLGTADGTYAYTGTGVSGLYLFGAQYELGAFATSYIPTLLTYSGRGSVATYIGDNGLIQTAAANVARYQRNIAGATQLLLEGAATNLMLWSANFNSASDWLASRAFIMPNAIVAPDGTKTGAKVVATAGTTTDHAIYKSINSVSANGVTHTLSVYAKAGEFNWLLLAETATYVGRYFNLATGEIGGTTSWVAPVSSSITPVGNGWYRCQISWVQSGTVLRPVLEVAKVNNNNSYTGDDVSGIYLWGAQLETGSVATSYIPSTETFTGRSGSATYFDPSGVMRTAPSGLARYDFDPVTGLSKGLLLEGAGQNLLTYSASFGSVGTVVAAAATGSASTAPDGTTTATLFVPDTTTAEHRGTISFTSSALTYTFSMFLKYSGKQFAQFSWNASQTSDYANFDLVNGTVTAGTNSGATITPCGSGWYRCTMTSTLSVFAGGVAVYSVTSGSSGRQTTSLGDSVNGFYIWGHQLETGSVATSYIPTTTTSLSRVADTATSVANSRAADVWSSGQATRSAELVSMTGTNFSQWYRQDEGTMYAEAEMRALLDASTNFHAWYMDGNSSNYMFSRIVGNTGKPQLYASANGSDQWHLVATSAIAKGSFVKTALGYKTNDIAYSANTDTILTDNSAVIPINTRLILGSADGVSGFQMLNGCIRRIAFYPKRLTNTELQGLTS